MTRNENTLLTVATIYAMSVVKTAEQLKQVVRSLASVLDNHGTDLSTDEISNVADIVASRFAV